ncbi:MAG: hypothetical protein AAFU85_31075 [Planctomycetota bacterium]
MFARKPFAKAVLIGREEAHEQIAQNVLGKPLKERKSVPQRRRET